jgi:glycosyltransferase involved in cell wall biosynthesis
MTKEGKYKYKFTVFTPSFNRANLLGNLYNSLKRQTFKDFEWIIVNDGSVDNTEELVLSWIEEGIINIKYFSQENKGIPSSFNFGVQKAKGKFFLFLGSDDFLLDKALERFLFYWDSIPKKDKQFFSGVCANCVYKKNNKIVGGVLGQEVIDTFPIKFNYKFKKIKGDRYGFQKTSILKEHPFPIFSKEKHISPAIIWNEIGLKYKTRYVNEALVVVEYQEDGITAHSLETRIRNIKGTVFYYLSFLKLKVSFYWKVRNLINYSRFSFHASSTIKKQVSDISTFYLKILYFLLLPFSFFFYFLDRKKYNKKYNYKKITFFIPSLEGGGAEKVFVNLVNYISSKDYQVDLILVNKKGEYCDQVSKNVRVIDLELFRSWKSIFPLIHYLKKEKPRVLISSLDHVNIIAIIAKKLARVQSRVIIRQANYFSASASRKIRSLANIFYKKADRIIAVSKGVKSDLIQNLKIKESKIETVYNPINVEGISKKSEEKVVSDFIDNDSKIILAVGSFEKQKNFSGLIRAFEILSKKRPDIKLVILGEGSLRLDLESLVEELSLGDKVLLPGFVDNPYKYMKRADVFVLSSINEGLPNVILEAMACGTPIVSTNCPSGPKEILKGGEYGILVDLDNPDSLAKAIDKTLDNPIESEKLINRAKDFSIDKIGKEYLKLFT